MSASPTTMISEPIITAGTLEITKHGMKLRASAGDTSTPTILPRLPPHGDSKRQSTIGHTKTRSGVLPSPTLDCQRSKIMSSLEGNRLRARITLARRAQQVPRRREVNAGARRSRRSSTTSVRSASLSPRLKPSRPPLNTVIMGGMPRHTPGGHGSRASQVDREGGSGGRPRRDRECSSLDLDLASNPPPFSDRHEAGSRRAPTVATGSSHAPLGEVRGGVRVWGRLSIAWRAFAVNGPPARLSRRASGPILLRGFRDCAVGFAGGESRRARETAPSTQEGHHGL